MSFLLRFQRLAGLSKRQVEMTKVIWEAVPYSSIVLRFMDAVGTSVDPASPGGVRVCVCVCGV